MILEGGLSDKTYFEYVAPQLKKVASVTPQEKQQQQEKLAQFILQQAELLDIPERIRKKIRVILVEDTEGLHTDVVHTTIAVPIHMARIYATGRKSSEQEEYTALLDTLPNSYEAIESRLNEMERNTREKIQAASEKLFTDYSDAEIESLLLHELGHLKYAHLFPFPKITPRALPISLGSMFSAMSSSLVYYTQGDAIAEYVCKDFSGLSNVLCKETYVPDYMRMGVTFLTAIAGACALAWITRPLFLKKAQADESQADSVVSLSENHRIAFMRWCKRHLVWSTTHQKPVSWSEKMRFFMNCTHPPFSKRLQQIASSKK